MNMKLWIYLTFINVLLKSTEYYIYNSWLNNFESNILTLLFVPSQTNLYIAPAASKLFYHFDRIVALKKIAVLQKGFLRYTIS